MPERCALLTRLSAVLVGFWLVLGAPGCGDSLPSELTGDGYTDVESADLRAADSAPLTDAAPATDTAVEPNDLRLQSNVPSTYDLRFDTSEDISSVSDVDWDCSLGPGCVNASTLQYCVDGIAQQVPCPDDHACPDGAHQCEPQICSTGDDVCVDDHTAQRCVEHQTRLDQMDCESSGCFAGQCTDRCWEGFQDCVDEDTYEICQDGEFVVASCPDDYLGASCFAGRCRTACERAALESDYIGCVFWAVDLDNIVDPRGRGPGAEGVAVVISNVSDYPAQIAIESGEVGALVVASELEPGEIQTFELFPERLIGTRLNRGAFRITSSVPVLAHQFNPLNREGTSSTDASLLLPESALSSRYRVMSYAAQGTNQRGFVTMIGVGTEPTTVSLTASGQTMAGVDYREVEFPLRTNQLGSLEPGQTTARVLGPFDVWQVESSAAADLTGTLVLSDGPVAVFAGTRCSNIPAGVPNCDHLEHQMLAVDSWDRTYVATPGPMRGSETTTFRVLSDFDLTYIETIPPVSGTPTTLNAGEFLTFELTEPATLFATQPVMVGQYLASGDAGAAGFGDPSFTIVPPVEQFRDSYAFFVPDSYETDAITLIRRVGAPESADIWLDGVDLGAAFGDLFEPVADSGFEVAEIIVDDGVHELESTRVFGVLVAGFDQDVSYAYPGGLQLSKDSARLVDDMTGRCTDGGWHGAPCDTGGSGACGAGATACGPHSICAPLLEPEVERCNGVDDDCDGTVDEGVCTSGFDLVYISPGSRLVELTEGDTQEFHVALNTVEAGDEPVLPVVIEWFIDDPDAPVALGDRFKWPVLSFEAGVHHVWVEATHEGAYNEYDWLVHIHDVPSNSPTLYGRVVNPEGRPMVDVPVTLRQPGTDFDPAPGSPSLTDFRGFYALALSPGRYDLMIDGSRWRPGELPKGRFLLGEAVLLGGDTRFDMALPLSRVYGYVYGPDFDGIPQPQHQSQVSVYPDRAICFDCGWHVWTDAEGYYEMLLFTGAQRFRVIGPSGAGFPTAEYDLVVDGEVRHDVYLEPPPPPLETTEITVTVIEQCTGGPVSEARMYFYGYGYSIGATTDANGQAQVQLPDGQIWPYLDYGGYAVPPVGPGRILLEPFLVPVDEDVVLEIPNAHVTGAVTDADGAGVAEVSLEVRGACRYCNLTTWSSETGAFEFYVIDSTYNIRVTPPADSGWANFSLPPEPPDMALTSCDEMLDIVLNPPVHRISGVVTALQRLSDGDVASGPVDNVRLQLIGPTESTFQTDSDGRFEFAVVPGEYELKSYFTIGALPRGRFTLWASGDRLTATDPASPVDVLLEPLELPITLVSGRVTNIEGGGLGLENVELRWIHDDATCEFCSEIVTTDADGYFDVLLFRAIAGDDDQWRGRYRVEVDPGEFYPARTYEDVVLEGQFETWDIAVGD